MSPTRRCGAERPNLCVEMRKKANFVSFLVDRSKIFIEMRLAEVGDMIYIVLYYYLRHAKRAGAENGIFHTFRTPERALGQVFSLPRLTQVNL